MVFAFFLGMCSFLAVSKNVKTSVGLGAAVTFVLVVTLPVNYLLQTKVLDPLGLGFLSFILFIAVIAGIVQIVEMAVEKYSPSLYGALGIFLPLIAVNCAIMGGSLFMQQRIVSTRLLTVHRQRLGRHFLRLRLRTGLDARHCLDGCHPREDGVLRRAQALQGLGITFITVGLMALAMMCFSGLKI